MLIFRTGNSISYTVKLISGLTFTQRKCHKENSLFNSFSPRFSVLREKVILIHIQSLSTISTEPGTLAWVTSFIFHSLVTTILWNKENYFHFINWGKWGPNKRQINYPEPEINLKSKKLILFFRKININKRFGLSLAKHVPRGEEYLEMRMNIMSSLVLEDDIIIYSILTFRFTFPPDLDKSLTVYLRNHKLMISCS